MKRPSPLLGVLLFLVLGHLLAPRLLAQPRPDPEPCNGPRAEVTGFITGPDGSPVRGAIIKYYGVHWKPDCWSRTWQFIETRSDSNGGYQIEVPLGKGRTLSVERTDVPGFSREFIPLAEVVPGVNRADHQFNIYRIRGTMVDASGAPVENAAVVYYLKPKGMLVDDSGLPRAPVRAGRFECLVHQPGTYRLWVRPGWVSVGITSHPDTVVVSSDTTVAITAEGYRIDGLVLGEGGGALSEAIVAADGPGRYMGMEDRSDQSGHYSLLLPAGGYRLAVIYPRGHVHACEPESISVTGPARINLRMK